MSKLMKTFFQVFILFLNIDVIGQVSINTSGTAPDASAMFDITSTSKGVLIPRMSTTERDMIGTPATSLLIYNTTTFSYNYWNGSIWVSMAAGAIKELSDADGDTKIEVEKNADEDLIRLSIANTERLRLHAKYLH